MVDGVPCYDALEIVGLLLLLLLLLFLIKKSVIIIIIIIINNADYTQCQCYTVDESRC